MKPIFETIQPNPGTSFHIQSENLKTTEVFWHLHPEYELVYIKNGSAEQHIGCHISRYNDGTLLFIGPNIPHSNLGNIEYEDNLAVVIQMTPEFLENKVLYFNELKFLQPLLTRSQQGIWFGKTIQKKLAKRLEKMSKLSPYYKFFELIDLLKELTLTEDYTLLNADSVSIDYNSPDYLRIVQINQYISNNYKKQIQLSDLANLVGLTESSFSRYFKKLTGKTFVTFLNEFRVQKACQLLLDKKNNISGIMYQAGFNEAAHFTRVFKKFTSYTPREFRTRLHQSSRIKILMEV